MSRFVTPVAFLKVTKSSGTLALLRPKTLGAATQAVSPRQAGGRRTKCILDLPGFRSPEALNHLDQKQPTGIGLRAPPYHSCWDLNIRVEGAALLTVRQPTKILRPPRDKELLVGDNTVMRCRAKGDEGTPLQVEWLKDGDLIYIPSDASDSRFSRLPNNALVVTSARVEDSGVYTCRASTPFDATSVSASLIVREVTTTTTTTTAASTTTTTLATSMTTLYSILHLDYCPPPYERIHKYVCVLDITHIKLRWEDAAEFCRTKGGQLAWENTGERILQDFLEEHYGPGGSQTSTNTGWPFWVGGREDDRGEWRWLDGSPVSAALWAPHHRKPSGRRAAEEDWCLVLDGYQEYLGTALRCHSKRYFLCRLK
ncbi:Neuroglian [Chionoecetes opilio]|uniref:Neuroglian n=1 Tax=Chionoecetes opilio TaxID=41210 RepID=A0A8J8WA89_CHIOP|nr:Neuroglian [Chionoecetes opilio]